jgi:endonuclease/exonuclease/phosphatase family metal-dependent hydrolase
VTRTRRSRWGVSTGCLAVLLTACATAVRPDVVVVAPAPAPVGAVRLLQMNLCNSGIADCYTGRATAEAAAVIRAERPDLVTLNEICRDDLPALERALADVTPGGRATSAFRAAGDRPTGGGYRCRNGQEYGIGLVSRWPGAVPTAGLYPAQDTDDPEERAWLCLGAAPRTGTDLPVAVCTTHLADTKRPVAAAQCAYLFGTVVPGMRQRTRAPLVVGGDLNLGAGGAELGACLPDGAAAVDDGGPQHVVATADLVVDSSRTIDLRGTTDHPGLLVALAPAAS